MFYAFGYTLSALSLLRLISLSFGFDSSLPPPRHLSLSTLVFSHGILLVFRLDVVQPRNAVLRHIMILLTSCASPLHTFRPRLYSPFHPLGVLPIRCVYFDSFSDVASSSLFSIILLRHRLLCLAHKIVTSPASLFGFSREQQSPGESWWVVFRFRFASAPSNGVALPTGRRRLYTRCRYSIVRTSLRLSSSLPLAPTTTFRERR